MQSSRYVDLLQRWILTPLWSSFGVWWRGVSGRKRRRLSRCWTWSSWKPSWTFEGRQSSSSTRRFMRRTLCQMRSCARASPWSSSSTWSVAKVLASTRDDQYSRRLFSHLLERLDCMYSNFRQYAHPLHVKEGIITEKVFPVFSESFFGLVLA